MTDLMVRPVLDDHSTGDDAVCHVTCCKNANIALCATDVTHSAWRPDDETSCIVCADLERQPIIMCPFTKQPCNMKGDDGPG